MAELHLIGQIIGGSDFGTNQSLCCRWRLSSGKHTKFTFPATLDNNLIYSLGENWRVLEGASEGQTQLDTPQIGSLSSWNHPLDVHFATRGLQGWPQIHLQIYQLDSYSRSNLIGYATTPLPTRPGIHFINVPAWRPLGSIIFKFNQ